MSVLLDNFAKIARVQKMFNLIFLNLKINSLFSPLASKTLIFFPTFSLQTLLIRYFISKNIHSPLLALVAFGVVGAVGLGC